MKPSPDYPPGRYFLVFRLIDPTLRLIWLGMLLSTAWALSVGWLAALKTGLPIFLQVGLVMLGATLGGIGTELCHQWRFYMVRKLYIEDIVDGLCLDRGAAINNANAWKWYRRQGSPWRIDPNRERPQVRVVVALARLEDIKRAFRD